MIIYENLDDRFSMIKGALSNPKFEIVDLLCLYLLCRETLQKLELRNFHKDKIAAFLPKHIKITRGKSLYIIPSKSKGNKQWKLSKHA